MTMKEYKVFFAKTTCGKEGKPIDKLLRQAFKQHGANLPVMALASERYQVRNLQLVGSVWKACFAKLRHDAPHVVSASDQERELVLEDGEHIIEKCFFLYREHSNVVVWQANRNAGGLTRAQEYLGLVFNDYVSLPMVMNDAELDRVLAGQLYEIDFAYVRPASLTMQAPKWTKNAFDMMSSVDAAHAKFNLRAPRKGALAANIKQMVRQLITEPGAEKLRVKLTDDSEPVELFMAPLKDTIRVEIFGRYPESTHVYSALESAFDRQRKGIPDSTEK